MAKQPKTRASDVALSQNEQFSDILLVLDKKELTLSAVSDVDKKGKIKTVDAGKENEFMKIDRGSSIIENIISNFWRQAKDPTRFNLFRLTLDEFKNNRQAIKDIKTETGNRNTGTHIAATAHGS